MTSTPNIPDALRGLAADAAEAAEYAALHPGHVETNGRVIADLYKAISMLATFTAQAIDARSVQTACGLDPKGESAVDAVDAPR